VLFYRQNQAAGDLGRALDVTIAATGMEPVTGPRTVSLSAATSTGISLLGGKAMSLVMMMRLGLRVPPAFVLTTTLCEEFLADRAALDASWAEVRARVRGLEMVTHRAFGGTPPLLVAVRSGAAVSLPGMMRTALSVGAATSPQRAEGQLRQAVAEVFASCCGARFEVYRRAGIADGPVRTAVTVQAMVFGDRDDRSGTGVYFSRNPVDGTDAPFGDWMPQAQGEALVSGERDPLPLSAFAAAHPGLHDELIRAGRAIEQDLGYPCEVEYTVQSGVLYFLQARRAVPSPAAAGLWGAGAGPAASPASPDVRGLRVVATGTPACPGVRSGRVTGHRDEAERLVKAGIPVIYAREKTSPADIGGFAMAAAVMTEVGGATSHAAIISRQLGVPCVVGCSRGAIAPLLGCDVVLDGAAGKIYAAPVPRPATPQPGEGAGPARHTAGEEPPPGPEQGPEQDHFLALARALYAGRFQELNTDFKQLCTRAQIDPAFAGQPLQRQLAGLRDGAGLLIAEFAAHYPHLRSYAAAFDAAAGQVLDGHTSYLTGLGIGSCHDIWMQLHADLLQTLGIERSEDDY
jgi:pyruvate, orthophosphate dikinase